MHWSRPIGPFCEGSERQRHLLASPSPQWGVEQVGSWTFPPLLLQHPPCQPLSLGHLRPHLEPSLGLLLFPGLLRKEFLAGSGASGLQNGLPQAFKPLPLPLGPSGSLWEAEDGGGKVRFSIHRSQRSACPAQVRHTI